jgi:sterol desaturase/sphingolipid hydroxylase (fatty acid hydroxylase superfamily)
LPEWVIGSANQKARTVWANAVVHTIGAYLATYLAVLAAQLIVAYLIPAGIFHYLLFDGIVNAADHCGHEIVAAHFREHALLKYANAVTHQDLHHSRFNYNFGQYLNVWDRLMMGTFLDRSPERRALHVDPTGAMSTKSKVGEKRLDAGEVC